MAKRNRTRRTETPTEKASVAQSEEQVPCEDTVAGSTPVRGSVTNLDDDPAVEVGVLAKEVVKQAVVKAKKFSVDVRVCAVCGAVVSSSQNTCPKCGESSWL